MKRFYNNTIMSGAFSKALRVFALLCVLLGFSSSAWGDELNSSYQGKSIYVAGSFNGWSTSAWKLSTSDNNYYSGEFTIDGKSDNYTFKIYSEGKYFAVDGYWFTSSNTTATKLVTDNNDMQIDCISESGNISVKFELYCEYSGTSRLTVTQTTIVADPEYALGGWINKSDKKSYSNGIKLTKQNDGTYTTTTSFTQNADQFNGKYGQWVQIYGNDSKKYGFSTKEQSVALNTEATLVEVNADDGFFIETTIGTNYTFTWNPTTKKFKYAGDDPVDPDPTPGDAPSCDVIEIWCKGVNSYIDMYCYAWNPDNDSQHPLGDWYGSTKQTTGTYDGNTYAVWTVTGYDKLSIIFNAGDGNAQTNDITGLLKGHRYIYTLADPWGGTTPTCTVIDCSGGSEDVVNGTIYLDISSLQGWDDAGAVLKAKLTYTDASTEEIELTLCDLDANIFYVNELLNLNNISKVNMMRYDNNGSSLWNQTGDITFNQATPCIKLTSWNGNYANYMQTVYTGSCGVEQNSPVLISKDAEVSADGEAVTLHGYLAKTFCTNITEYGFVYCAGTATEGCTPTRNSIKLEVDGGQLYRGEEFQLTVDHLANGYTYGYKAYVMVGDMMYISNETGYFRLADCTTRPTAGGDPIEINVNAALGESFIDDCSLTYGSLKTAVEKLRNSYNNDEGYQYVTYNSTNQSYNLQQPVTIKVHYYDDNPDDNQSAYLYRGTTDVGKYAGNNKPINANLLENFNRVDADPEHTLTIKAGTKVAKPLIHHIVLRNSKNIVLDSLYIYSDPDGVGDNALEMDINVASGSDGWHALNNQTGPGIVNNYLDNANILITNCVIESDGFTGMHITSYNGVTFKNNDFESKFEDGSDNDINYGASAKFIYCKNIKFIQNNFRGDHATLMWIQEVNNMLVMNNVFWNTNKYLQKSGTHVPAAMRIVTQWNSTQYIGFYYNTFYFAENDKTSESMYNFLHFSHTVSGGSGSYNLKDMYFKYNNCYSYDPDCPGSEAIDLGEYADNFCPNNFWSQYDQDIYKTLSDAEQDTYVSKFAFGCETNTFTNVKEQVCATTATGPSSLIVRGDDMNAGSAPTTEELLGFTLTTDEARADRYYTNVRPEGSGWTYGAYQSKAEVSTDVIYWVGLTDDWDDRNNWEYETKKDPNDTSENPEMIRQRVSCVNTFSEDLKVVIEEKGTIEITGGRKWPKVPDSFTDERSNYDSREHVSAGLDESNLGSQFAKSIELEYGAGIKGVENLTDGETNYYNTAKVGFTAPRSQWILVGTVVKPLENGVYRNVKSGDYFIANHLPHVYMHQAVIDGTNAKWDETFASLEIEVEPTTVFAINIPDQYGKFKLPARIYNTKYSANYDPTEPISYDKFSGKFVNDAALPKYTGLTAGQPVLLNNSYPANIDAKQLETETGGTVQYYNYTAGTFMNTSATSEVVWLRPQHGFIFTPATGKTDLQITSTMIVDGNTRTRSAEVTMPTFSLNLFNANTGVGYSNVVVRYDEFKDIETRSASDVEKVFSPNTDVPELYIVDSDRKLSRLDISSSEQVIPLGVRLKSNMNIKFEKAYFEGFNNVTLVDTYTGKTYDLLRKSYTTEILVPGDIEGRFYLNLENAPDIEIPEEGGDTPTEIEENMDGAKAINIFVEEADNTIHVVTDGVELKNIYVSDMAGKTMSYKVSGYAANLKLPVAQGVYTINVIGDTANRTEKVILK